MLGYPSYTTLVLPICVALPIWYWLRRPKNTIPYPPGPKGYPFIGNVLDFPTGVPLWKGFASMAKQHGRTRRFRQTLGLTSHAQHLSISGTDVLHLSVPGMDMVVLSTSDAISDLLDQRSAIYSDKVRPRHFNSNSPSFFIPPPQAEHPDD